MRKANTYSHVRNKSAGRLLRTGGFYMKKYSGFYIKHGVLISTIRVIWFFLINLFQVLRPHSMEDGGKSCFCC